MSYHDDFKQSLDETFRKAPSETDVYWEVLHKMNTGFFERSYVDIFVQHAARRYDIYDAWVFAQLHAMAASGELKVLRVDVGSEPDADSAIAKNIAALDKLPEPFHGTFWGGRHDFDGNIRWDCPIEVSGERWEPQTTRLEVGTTKCATTWMHLCGARWLARWPYGSTDVFILRWKTAQGLPSLLKKRSS